MRHAPPPPRRIEGVTRDLSQETVDDISTKQVTGRPGEAENAASFEGLKCSEKDGARQFGAYCCSHDMLSMIDGPISTC